MSFPTNPSDNQQYANSQGTIYKFSAADGAWSIVSQTIIGLTGAMGVTGFGYNDYPLIHLIFLLPYH